MPAPINVSLRGYLDFLGLKNGGMNPQIPAGVLGPVLDLQRWYLESRVIEYSWARVGFLVANADAGFIAITSTSPTNLVNGAGNLIVPQSETWILLPGTQITCTLDNVAAQFSTQPSYAVLGPAGVTVSRVPSSDHGNNASDAAYLRVGTGVVDDPYFVGPGSTIAGFQNGSTVPAGQIDFGGTLRIVRLRI